MTEANAVQLKRLYRPNHVLIMATSCHLEAGTKVIQTRFNSELMPSPISLQDQLIPKDSYPSLDLLHDNMTAKSRLNGLTGKVA